MTAIKYMSLLTTFSVFAALISIVWQAFLSLKQLNKVTMILTGLLAIESGLMPQEQLRRTPPKVALGYGACTDLLIDAPNFLNYTGDLAAKLGPDFVADEVSTREELLQAFAYYFHKGAAVERFMPNADLFRELVQTAKTLHRNDIQWVVGGNAPLMGIRFHTEGAQVLLGARMSHKLRRLIPSAITVAGDEIPEDDIHIIFEYKAGDNWGNLAAPRANRFILHNDQNNPHLNALEQFGEALKAFQPDLLVISGLQMMDNYKFEPGVREKRLQKVRQQLLAQPAHTLRHFEMASYVDIELMQRLRHYVLPNVDSLGMNEQELGNLVQVMKFGNTSLATDWNPRVATSLDQMREVFKIVADDFYRKRRVQPRDSAANGTASPSEERMLSRIHLHTLAFQAMLAVKNSKWNRTKVAVAKASLTAHRYVCQSNEINPSSAVIVLDDSFAISRDANAKRINIDVQNPVACWDEAIAVGGGQEHEDAEIAEVEICVAPVLVCRVARKTAGAGDNISAAGLASQI